MRYIDLVVREAGYSAYFVTLSPEVQDDIIRCTEQSLCPLAMRPRLM